MFELRNVTYKIKDKSILDLENIVFSENEVVGIVGPNGSGKTTLLRLMAKLINPTSGEILLNDVMLPSFSRKILSQNIALVQQHKSVTTDILVKDAIKLGRLPWVSFFESWSKHDEIIVENAIAMMGLNKLKLRSWGSLSGGEQQKVSIAQGLAQDTPCIILDEPTNHLDMKNQIEVLKWIRSQSQKKTIFVSLHDLNHAFYCCDKVLILQNGMVRAFGKPNNTLTQENIEKVFEIEVNITDLGNERSFVNFLL